MPFALTLRFRIISLFALFTILIFAAFTALLISRQLDVITENNRYRARVGTFAVKGSFERALLSTVQTGDPEKAFQNLIPILQKGELVDEILVADLNGKVVAASNSYLVGSTLMGTELSNARYASENYSPQNWLHAIVEPGRIEAYVPVTIDDAPRYVAVLRHSLGNMGQAIRQSAGLVTGAGAGLLVIIAPFCLVLIRSILGPIRALNEATREISSGNLGRKVEVTTEDELGDLAETFNEMTSALVAMKARAENANPLTKLPGNNMIHEEIEKRLKSKKKFVAVYSDLDNFKAFNDKYGIGAGDKAIKLTAQIMREAIQKKDPAGFLGHEGGDDFFILTSPEKSGQVTDYVCREFDKRVRQFYSQEDQARGKIVSKDREGNVKEFPIMTISLAGVSNADKTLTSYAQITNICAEVKKKAKLVSKSGGKSAFVLDRRTREGEQSDRKPGGASPPEKSPGPAPEPPAAGSDPSSP